MMYLAYTIHHTSINYTYTVLSLTAAHCNMLQHADLHLTLPADLDLVWTIGPDPNAAANDKVAAKDQDTNSVHMFEFIFPTLL
jgi:hypothetical protein